MQLNQNPSSLTRSVALVPVDDAPIRQEALAELKQTEAELTELTQQWAYFREKDKPAFTSWLSSTFSPIHSEIQRVGYEIYEKRVLVEEVLQVAASRGISHLKAYEYLMAKKEAERLEQEQPEFQFDEEASDHSEGESDHAEENGSETTEDFSAQEDFRPQEDSPTSQKIKQLYRILVRKLHPDVALTQTQEDRSLWLQVQSAYNASDLQRLEGLLLLLGSAATESYDESCSVSELQAKKIQALKAIKAMRKRLKNAYRDRAWGFSQPDHQRQRRKVYKLIRSELEQDLGEAQQALESLNLFIEEYLLRD